MPTSDKARSPVERFQDCCTDEELLRIYLDIKAGKGPRTSTALADALAWRIDAAFWLDDTMDIQEARRSLVRNKLASSSNRASSAVGIIEHIIETEIEEKDLHNEGFELTMVELAQSLKHPHTRKDFEYHLPIFAMYCDHSLEFGQVPDVGAGIKITINGEQECINELWWACYFAMEERHPPLTGPDGSSLGSHSGWDLSDKNHLAEFKALRWPDIARHFECGTFGLLSVATRDALNAAGLGAGLWVPPDHLFNEQADFNSRWLPRDAVEDGVAKKSVRTEKTATTATEGEPSNEAL